MRLMARFTRSRLVVDTPEWRRWAHGPLAAAADWQVYAVRAKPSVAARAKCRGRRRGHKSRVRKGYSVTPERPYRAPPRFRPAVGRQLSSCGV